jgi:phenylacetic acid degradation operon negative regulatory protein
MRVSAKSVIVELLSAHPLESESVPVKQLVRAASVFDIAENSVRVAIVRLRAEGVVDSTERGHYRLGPAARPINDRVTAWRHATDAVRAWDGGWAGVFTAHLPRTDRPALRKRNQALKLLGFRELRPGLFVRPDNLVGGVASLRKRLVDLGLEADAAVFRLSQLSDEDEAEARGLWDVARMRALYADLVDQLDTSREAMSKMQLTDALGESFLLGREALRQIVLDPLLPEPLVPARERVGLIEAMRNYDAAGRELWRSFLLADEG